MITEPCHLSVSGPRATRVYRCNSCGRLTARPEAYSRHGRCISWNPALVPPLRTSYRMHNQEWQAIKDAKRLHRRIRCGGEYKVVKWLPRSYRRN